jgi:hypothetical protein
MVFRLRASQTCSRAGLTMITSFRSIRRLRERCVDDGRRSARDDGAGRRAKGGRRDARRGFDAMRDEWGRVFAMRGVFATGCDAREGGCGATERLND